MDYYPSNHRPSGKSYNYYGHGEGGLGWLNEPEDPELDRQLEPFRFLSHVPAPNWTTQGSSVQLRGNYPRCAHARPIRSRRRRTFQQVTAFSQWCEPTREHVLPKKEEYHSHHSSAASTSQRHHLLRQHPEAIFADPDTQSLLLDETSASRVPPPSLDSANARLLATGEISDLSDPEVVKGHLVLVSVAGQAADGLRLVSLVEESWTWEYLHAAIRVKTPAVRYEKEWFRDRAPITCIKFATNLERREPIRWLIVQKDTSTTIYEPELRAVSKESSTDSSSPLRLFARPLAIIRCDQTGGGPHTDVAFQSRAEGNPQLAIIDKSGSWSLWDVLGQVPVGQPRALKPVMRMRGNFYSIPQPSFHLDPGRHSHKVLLLSARKYRHRARRHSREEGPGPDSGSESESESDDEDSDIHKESDNQHPPREVVLMANTTSFYQYDIQTGKSAPALATVLRQGKAVRESFHRGEQIRDIAKSDLDPSQAFILTNESLIWVGAKETKSREVSLRVLVTFDHDMREKRSRRNKIHPAVLRLQVSPVTYINGQKGCFVCIWSSGGFKMTVYWLVYSKTDGVSVCQYREERIELQAPSKFVSMSMLPVSRAKQAGGKLDPALRKSHARFFQFFIMGNDLAVSSALCVWSDNLYLRLSPPDNQRQNKAISNPSLGQATVEEQRSSRRRYPPGFWRHSRLRQLQQRSDGKYYSSSGRELMVVSYDPEPPPRRIIERRSIYPEGWKWVDDPRWLRRLSRYWLPGLDESAYVDIESGLVAFSTGASRPMEEEATKKSRKREARQKRNRDLKEKLFGVDGGSSEVPASSQLQPGGGGPYTQPLPTIAVSSSQVGGYSIWDSSQPQPPSSSMGPVFSSQVGGTQNMSQVLAGRFGGRLGQGAEKKNKKKARAGFR